MWKNRSIDYNKREYLPDKKNSIVVKTFFSEGKLMKQFRDPLFLRGPSPSISEKFFHDSPSPVCPNFKNKNNPPLILGGEETM